MRLEANELSLLLGQLCISHLQIPFVPARIAQQHPSFQSALYRNCQDIELARLGQIIGCADSDRIHHSLGAADAGDDDYRGVFIMLGNLAQQFDAGGLGA